MKKRIWIPLVVLLAAACAIAAGALVQAGAFCNHSWQAATCTDAEICARCGKTQAAPLGHSWQNADCENPDICTRCGKTQGEAFGHIWQDADCENPEICAECGTAQGRELWAVLGTWPGPLLP